MKYTEEQQKLIDSLQIEEFNETVTNPYSGRSCELEPLAVALYDVIKGSELLGDMDTIRICLDIFVSKWPKEYYILLD
jgi:hypothetical protein